MMVVHASMLVIKLEDQRGSSVVCSKLLVHFCLLVDSCNMCYRKSCCFLLCLISERVNQKQFYDFILPEIRRELDVQTACRGGKGLLPAIV